jgi:hypothetical protein
MTCGRDQLLLFYLDSDYSSTYPLRAAQKKPK